MATREQPARPRFGDRYVIAADRVFDGRRVLEHHAVAVWGDRIAAVAPADRLSGPGPLIRFAGTLLPGFIDLHGHPLLGQVPPETILRHGLTTVRDTGGPLVAPSGGDGRLRVLGAGPILTAPGGYPIPVFGPGAGVEVPDVQRTRTAASSRSISVGPRAPGWRWTAAWTSGPTCPASRSRPSWLRVRRLRAWGW